MSGELGGQNSGPMKSAVCSAQQSHVPDVLKPGALRCWKVSKRLDIALITGILLTQENIPLILAINYNSRVHNELFSTPASDTHYYMYFMLVTHNDVSTATETRSFHGRRFNSIWLKCCIIIPR